ncbi:hypothetical protein [Streptomyces sp. PRh5]|nr:hypothetical protein [Streptomyces sp. PRh5]
MGGRAAFNRHRPAEHSFDGAQPDARQAVVESSRQGGTAVDVPPAV